MHKFKDDGFSLIELIIVLIITLILTQIGWTSFNRYSRRVKSFAAKTALKNIQKECEANSKLNTSNKFTNIPINSYSLDSGTLKNCSGNSAGFIVANPINKDLLPIWKYEIAEGTITCTYKGKDKTFTLKCLGQKSSDKKPWENVSCDGNNIVIARYTIDREGRVPSRYIMQGGGSLGHHMRMPNQDKSLRGYDKDRDKINFMIGVFLKKDYLELDDSKQPYKKILRTEEELVDYVSKWYEPQPIDTDMPPFIREMLENQPRDAEEFVSRTIKGGIFDRAARDLGHKGKNYFCD